MWRRANLPPVAAVASALALAGCGGGLTGSGALLPVAGRGVVSGDFCTGGGFDVTGLSGALAGVVSLTTGAGCLAGSSGALAGGSALVGTVGVAAAAARRLAPK